MFLDIISKIFIFVAIHAMIIFIIKSHIAVIKNLNNYKKQSLTPKIKMFKKTKNLND